MTTVLVHGNPETAAVWDPLLEALGTLGVPGEQVVRLSPPGFGRSTSSATTSAAATRCAWP